MGFVFHIFPGKRGKLRLQAQCITQIKALPEVSFGRVLQNSIDISLFQRAFRNFSAVSGVGCRSLRNLFAQNQCTGVAARKVQSASLFVFTAQLFDGTARCGQFFLTGGALHGEEIAAHLYQRQTVFGQHGQRGHCTGRGQIKLFTPRLAGGFLGALLCKLHAGQTQLGIARLSFASPEDMEQYLDCTPGSSSIMGLANDTENKVQLLMDEDIKAGEYLGCHPCINTSSLKLRTADVLETFLPAVHHEPIFVHLAGE